MKDQREYNEWFQAMIMKHCPDLFAEIAEKEHQGNKYLEATIPHSDKNRIIHLSTYGRELTAYVHRHHCHFDQYSDDDHDEEFLSAIGWIRDFMQNRIFICTHYNGDRISSSMSTYDSQSLQPRKNCRMEVLTYSEGPVK